MSKKIFIFIIYFILQLNCVFAQEFQGSGVFINYEGFILTNAHVIGNNSKSLLVEDYNGKSYDGKLIKIDYYHDIALIKVNCIPRSVASLRINTTTKLGLKPRLNELINLICYPQDNYKPSGGLVTKVSNKDLGIKGFTFSLSTEPGCSGGPIFDNFGLMIGLIYAGKIDNDGVYRSGMYTTKNGERGFEIYGINSDAIIPFLVSSKTTYAINCLENVPIWLKKLSPYQRINKVLEMGYPTVVKIYSTQY